MESLSFLPIFPYIAEVELILVTLSNIQEPSIIEYVQEPRRNDEMNSVSAHSPSQE